jgi:hypothetical protein
MGQTVNQSVPWRKNVEPTSGFASAARSGEDDAAQDKRCDEYPCQAEQDDHPNVREVMACADHRDVNRPRRQAGRIV